MDTEKVLALPVEYLHLRGTSYPGPREHIKLALLLADGQVPDRRACVRITRQQKSFQLDPDLPRGPRMRGTRP